MNALSFGEWALCEPTPRPVQRSVGSFSQQGIRSTLCCTRTECCACRSERPTTWDLNPYHYNESEFNDGAKGVLDVLPPPEPWLRTLRQFVDFGYPQQSQELKDAASKLCSAESKLRCSIIVGSGAIWNQLRLACKPWHATNAARLKQSKLGQRYEPASHLSTILAHSRTDKVLIQLHLAPTTAQSG